jgi:hypothetical protein
MKTSGSDGLADDSLTALIVQRVFWLAVYGEKLAR